MTEKFPDLGGLIRGVLLTTLLLGSGCQGAIGGQDSAADDDAGGAGGGTSQVGATSSTTRRLSLVELANTYRSVLGVVPAALGAAPPDSLGLTFDRVVNMQTVSPSHLDAFAASAREAGSTLIATQRLDDLVPACADNILPPLTATREARVSGAGLSAGPDWAIVAGSDPSALRLQYATEVTVSYSHTFPAAGTYTVALRMDVLDGTGQTMTVGVDGALADSWNSFAATDTYETTVTVDDAGARVFDYALQGSGNFTVEFPELTVNGPLDPNPGATAERDACAKAIVDTLAPLAFRRPIETDERDRIVSLIPAAKGDYGEAVLMVFEAIFANPSFLYLVEVGEPVEGSPGTFMLSPHERAARLSYSLCESPPDAALRKAADEGKLSTEAEVALEVRRLMDAPCGEAAIQRFFGQWLWLNRVPTLARDPVLFPEIDAEVQAGMLSETQRFIRESIYTDDASLEDLFSAEHSWPDPRSAFLYGLSGVADQTRTVLPKERAGLLMQPSILAATSLFDGTSPVRRGVYVLHQILCQDLPPPPPDLMVAPPPADPEATTRERWQQHSDNPACSGCHTQIDPIGFAFEEFDAIGRYRTTENGLPVDATGGIPTIGHADGSIVGGAALARAVSESPEMVSCFARQWLRFSLGRMDTEGDLASLAIVEKALEAGSLKDALASLTATSAFTHRKQEVSP